MFNLGLIPDHLVANWECFWTNKWPLYDHCQRMPLPCGQQYSHFQNSASIEEENVLRNINSIKPDVANPKIEYFCTARKEKISGETSSHSSKDKNNLKSIHLNVQLYTKAEEVKIQSGLWESCPSSNIAALECPLPRNCSQTQFSGCCCIHHL